MDTGLVRKGIIADHRFIDRNRDAGNLRNQAGGRIELLARDIGVEVEIVFARAQRHHHFFQ